MFAEPGPMTLFDHLEEFGDTVAVIDDGQQTKTYSQLVADGDQLAAQIGPHQLVLCLTNNCYAAVAGYVGLMRRKAVPLLLPDSTPDAELREICEAYKPDYIYRPAPDEDAQTGALHRLGSFALFPHKEVGTPPLNESLGLLLTTSGSTGSRTFVRLSTSNVSSNAEQIIDYLSISPSDRAITTMPMSYSYGLSIINSHLAAGASLITTNEAVVRPSFWALLNEHAATNFGGVPFIYEMLKRLRFHKMELPSLRYITQAGGRLDPELVTYFADYCRDQGKKFFVMYGQTEATARMSYVPPEQVLEKPNSVGIAIPGGNFRLIEGEIDNDKAARVSGELRYEGPNVSLGYAKSRKDLAQGDDNNGVLTTGDIAEIDEDGFIYIVGRKKRFLKLYGNRINLAEVESILLAEGFPTACAGEDDNLLIFTESLPDIEKIKQVIKSKPSFPTKGYTIVGIEKFPRSANGKISYHQLNTEYRPD